MFSLTTPHLQLRELTLDDVPALNAIQSDPITMKHYPLPFTLERTNGWVQNSIDSYREYGFGRWAVLLRETGELIGDCGFMRSSINGVIENDIGYIISHVHHSKGYGTEAAKAALDYGINELKLTRICANMATDNIPSWRVAEKIGMKRVGEFLNARNRDYPTFIYVWELD